MKRLESKYIALSIAALLGGAAFVGGTSLAVSASDHPEANGAKPSLNLKTDGSAPNRSGALTSSFAPIVKQVAPSVVQITVTSKADRQLSDPQMQLFQRFFGNQFGPQMPEQSPEHALGSGVIVSADGYILTNNHVVKNAKDIKVLLSDGRNLAGKVIGTDEKSDVALIKINATNLPVITFADSDKVEIGDVVLAIGDPFGIGQTVTSGIVSAEHRSAAIDGTTDGDEDFIQTDAAINPGNSGGALVDTQGRLVGINTAILSRSGGNQGIGFAVPTNLCRWVMESLIKNGTVKRGLLGVGIQNLDASLAQAFKLDRTKGALVSQITPGGPADAAGIKSGDVITQFNGKPVQDSNALKVAVAETTPGTTVPVQVERNGQTQTINVTLKELTQQNLADNDSTKPDHQDSLNGVAVDDLDEDTRSELNAPPDVHGALVKQVDPSSASYAAGLRPGDVITEINHDPIKNAKEAVKATEHPKSSSTLVKFWRHGQYGYLAVDEGN